MGCRIRTRSSRSPCAGLGRRRSPTWKALFASSASCVRSGTEAMPELPEAETIARQLSARLLGATITECRVARADIVREGLSTLPWYRGARLVSARRLGKSVGLEAERSGETRYLVFELGMTGLLFFTLLDPSYRKHTHLTLSLPGSVPALYSWNPRQFGLVYLLDGPGLARFAKRRFGCDPFTGSWGDVRGGVGRRPGRLKALPMRPPGIAGLRNN